MIWLTRVHQCLECWMGYTRVHQCLECWMGCEVTWDAFTCGDQTMCGSGGATHRRVDDQVLWVVRALERCSGSQPLLEAADVCCDRQVIGTLPHFLARRHQDPLANNRSCPTANADKILRPVRTNRFRLVPWANSENIGPQTWFCCVGRHLLDPGQHCDRPHHYWPTICIGSLCSCVYIEEPSNSGNKSDGSEQTVSTTSSYDSNKRAY